MANWAVALSVVALVVPSLAAAVVWIDSGDYRTAVAWWRAQWYRLRDHEPADPYPPEAAEAPDELMDVADGLGFQSAEPWTGGRIGGAYTGTGRLSEGWIAYAETEFDWHAAEYMATRKAAKR